MSKLTIDEFNKVKSLSDSLNIENPRWRIGQSFFNALYIEFPEIADKVRGSSIDMFYNNDNIFKFKTEFVE